MERRFLSSMRIIFCGTPEYAVPSLLALHALPGHTVVGVVSQPDRPKGRTQIPTPPPVVEAARKLSIPGIAILQPKSINNRVPLEKLRALQPDVLCVVAYGGLLKQDALSVPRLCAINAHGSLLPRHRGASPIQAALLAGDPETGVTIIKMELALDSGPMLLMRSFPIAPGDNAGTLHDKLAQLSAECFVESIQRLAAGNANFEAQNHALATYVTKLEKDSGRIDWTKPAPFLDRFIRAMNPWPGAWTSIGHPSGKPKMRVRISRAKMLKNSGESVAGTAHVDPAALSEGIPVGCGEGGTLLVQEIQPEGKREMSCAEYLRGAGRQFVPLSKWE